MKKIITSLAALLCAITMNAKDYTGQLTIKCPTASVYAYQNATISLNEQENGLYTFTLKNFTLGTGTDAMKIGNVVLENVLGSSEGVITLNTNQNIEIQKGDEGDDWNNETINAMGVDGKIPVVLTAHVDTLFNNMAANIVINIPDMNVAVTFETTKSQINNSDFENFHKETYAEGKSEQSGYEPDYWHSFLTADGEKATYAQMAGVHTFIAEGVTRPGSTGSNSLLLKSSALLKIVANGTVTTGRICAGSLIATDTANHSYTDTSSTGVDAQGNPFYSTIGVAPDSIKVWVKYKQGTVNKDYPYATVSAILTDGTYYQDPEDKPYTNVLAKATNAKIESNGFAWQEITIPFDYSYGASYTGDKTAFTNAAIHVTISTNAGAGKGSGTDSLYVDDLSLVYNAGLKSVKFKGNDVNISETLKQGSVYTNDSYSLKDFEVEPDGKNATTFKDVVTVLDPDWGEETQEAHIYVVSADLQTVNKYTIYINGSGTYTGVKKVETATANPSGIKAIYNLNGQRVSSMNGKGVFIVEKNDGTTTKVLNK